MWALALAGCLPLPRTPIDTATPPPGEPPALVSHDLACDVDRDLWTLTVEATAPTGGGTSFWTRDGVYLERHPVVAAVTQPDGAGETLTLLLSVATDWRTQKPGVSTAFGCASDASVRFVLLATDGAAVDCFDEGPPLDWSSVDGVTTCP